MVKSKFLVLVFVILFFSCKEKREDEFQVKRGTPEALQKSGETDISSFSV